LPIPYAREVGEGDALRIGLETPTAEDAFLTGRGRRHPVCLILTDRGTQLRAGPGFTKPFRHGSILGVRAGVRRAPPSPGTFRLQLDLVEPQSGVEDVGDPADGP
jgi:hypothetical protein